ncbi:hypothetical protein QFZ76_006880 [Streptomyces sp. V4I2]|nr:hypothetical protein [Streptomyces sp. V4I2]
MRFVQAGALLRQRERLRAGAGAVDEFGVFADATPVDAPFDAPFDTSSDSSTDPDEREHVPLPALGEAAAPAPLLAARLSESARATLRFAVALGGEVPHQAHLPALVGDTHADAALGELASCGLVSPVGARYRLAAGVQAQLEAAGYGDDIEAQARTAAQHYAWWAGHPSVTPERVCAEADAVLAALGLLVPGTTPPAEDEESVTVLLARTAAPAFAAGGHWSAWERALRSGAEASGLAGDVSEQAYFHHELGILALCGGQLDRARAELESSIGMRGALADKRGAVAGRRALALVADRSGTVPGLAAMAGEEVPDARYEESQSPPGGVPAAFPQLQRPADSSTLVTYQASSPSSSAPRSNGAAGSSPASHKARGGLKGLAKRNLVAAGAGALLVAVLGTVVTLGATSENDANNPSDQVGVNPSASQGLNDGSLGADVPKNDDGSGDTGPATSRPTDPGPDGTYGTSDDPTPTEAAEPSDRPSGTQGSSTGSSTPSRPTTPPPSPSKPPTSPSKPPTTPTSPTPTPTTPTPTPTPTTPTPTTTPSTSDSASGPASSPVESSSSAGAPQSSEAGTPSSSGSVI